MSQKWYVLIAVVALIQLSGVHSQPLTPAPPGIFCKHLIYGYPLGTPSSNDIIRDLYALSSNDTTKFADWVCCHLTWHGVDAGLSVGAKAAQVLECL